MYKKIKFIWIIIICIIFIMGIIIIKKNVISKNKVDNNVEPNNVNVRKFKKFSFQIPGDVSFSNVDSSDKFVLESDAWKAIVTIFMDMNDYIIKYQDIYYNILLDQNYHVDKPYVVDIDNNLVVIYNNKNENINSLLCYFKTISPFAYEVELYNNDNSFDTKNLSEVMKILLDSQYDSKSEEKYLYYSTELDSQFKEAINDG